MTKSSRQGEEDFCAESNGGEGAGEVVDQEDADGAAEACSAEVGDIEPAGDGSGV